MIELANAFIVDPLHPLNGQSASLYIDKGLFVAGTSGVVDHVLDLKGALTMAGGIDIHTHIGGGKVNLARLLMAKNIAPEERTVWPTVTTGKMYARMGYTSCFEPAMLLSSARHTHLELADTPLLDSGAFVVLGNEDWLLSALSDPKLEDDQLQSLVAWSVQASQALAVKVVNPAGISAFKFNSRKFDVDDLHPKYGVSPRQVIRRLTAAVDQLQFAHPLHVHASNLGMPGNIESTIQTLNASEGRRLHLTHAQFHCYTDTGPHGMGSGATILADYINEHDNISVDIGQVMFGQTVTISADSMAQTRNARYGRPNRPHLIDIECQAGCGVVPIRYEDKQYVHSLQWTIGLELMLLVKDPWRVFLTTDHPNGAPFTTYPHLMRLLMDRGFRQSMLEKIHPQVAERSVLKELDREYTLNELAIITRAAPAKILGLHNQGSLREGCCASLASYPRQDNWEDTFAVAQHVFKSGVEIVRAGKDVQAVAPCQTWTEANIEYDPTALKAWVPTLEQMLQMPHQSLMISAEEMHTMIRPLSASVV